MTGKNFSGNNMGQRRKSDLYETPYSMVQQLLDVEPFDINAITLEPACGNGAILKVLRNNGFSLAYGYDRERNFLSETVQHCQIITNPPFSLAYEFITTAKRIATEKFAFLLPLSYLHGKQRLDGIYSDKTFPLSRVYVFCRYPMLGDPLREDGKYRTGMMVYAWFVWDRQHASEPNIRWIDNQRFVLSKADL